MFYLQTTLSKERCERENSYIITPYYYNTKNFDPRHKHNLRSYVHNNIFSKKKKKKLQKGKYSE